MSKFNHYTKHKSTKIKDSTKNQIIKLSQNQSIINPYILPISLSSPFPRPPAPAPALLIPKQCSNNHIKRLLLHFISAFYLSVSSYRDTIVQLHTESLYNYIQYNCTIVSGAIFRLYNQLSADCINLSFI